MKDSTGMRIAVGDTVRFRGINYVIAGFRPGEGRMGTAAIVFTKPPETTEIPDEISVDLVPGYSK